MYYRCNSAYIHVICSKLVCKLRKDVSARSEVDSERLMKNFIIFFHEKEGTSALVRLLDNFHTVSIVHQTDKSGWEPFDRHNCGELSAASLERCLDYIFDESPLDLQGLNGVYSQTSTKPLDSFDKSGSVGFKMRFLTSEAMSPLLRPLAKRSYRVDQFVKDRLEQSFRQRMFSTLKRHDVVVFIAARQDLLRWALSKYHGDGSGNRGHMQFKIASGEMSRDSVGKIEVDCERFSDFIEECRGEHAEKRALADAMTKQGISVYPLRYEQFLSDQTGYLHDLFEKLGQSVTQEQIDAARAAGMFFDKVHSDDISESVVNHEEVMGRFGDCFEAW